MKMAPSRGPRGPRFRVSRRLGDASPTITLGIYGHARVLNAPAGLAQSPGKRGKTNEVLLTLGALDGLYERLALLRRELMKRAISAGGCSQIGMSTEWLARFASPRRIWPRSPV
jgi:hypothetical protein